MNELLVRNIRLNKDHKIISWFTSTKLTNNLNFRKYSKIFNQYPPKSYILVISKVIFIIRYV